MTNATLFLRVFVLPVLIILSAGCASTRYSGRSRELPSDNLVYVEKGVASYYSHSFEGRTTANGENYYASNYTAAHPSLPFGSLLVVRRRSNGRFVIVRINDRGPAIPDRRLDLSYMAAKRLGMLRPGLAEVDIFLVPKHSFLAAQL